MFKLLEEGDEFRAFLINIYDIYILKNKQKTMYSSFMKRLIIQDLPL